MSNLAWGVLFFGLLLGGLTAYATKRINGKGA